jgi:O-antigen/teichoic acid export membrane protein
VSKLQIGRGAVYLYIENIGSMLFGYAFWFILSRITTPEVVGISSSLISIATMFTAIAAVGVPLGAQRFLGKIFLERRFEDSIIYLKSSFLIVSIGLLGSGIVVLLGRETFLSNFSPILVNMTLVLIITSTISVLLRSIIIASLETKKILFATIISSAVKLFVVVSLLYFGMDEVGILIAFTTTPLLTSVILMSDVRIFLKQASKKTILRFMDSFKGLLKASVASWIPLSIETIGAQLGIIVVLGIEGPTQAGFYFIAFQISMGILSVIWALEGTTYPALSAKDKGRRRFVWKTIKICLIILLPISFAVIFYSINITELFGSSYSEGSPSLQILLLSVFPTTIMNAIGILTYAYGNYRDVLFIGLATAIPRSLLYFVLVPWFGSIGAALSYTLGALFGYFVSLSISRRLGMTMHWREAAFMIVIPLSIAYFLSSLNVHFVIGIILSILISYLLFLKLKLIDRNDVQDYLTVLPSDIANPVIKIINKIGVRLNPDY